MWGLPRFGSLFGSASPEVLLTAPGPPGGATGLELGQGDTTVHWRGGITHPTSHWHGCGLAAPHLFGVPVPQDAARCAQHQPRRLLRRRACSWGPLPAWPPLAVRLHAAHGQVLVLVGLGEKESNACLPPFPYAHPTPPDQQPCPRGAVSPKLPRTGVSCPGKGSPRPLQPSDPPGVGARLGPLSPLPCRALAPCQAVPPLHGSSRVQGRPGRRCGGGERGRGDEERFPQPRLKLSPGRRACSSESRLCPPLPTAGLVPCVGMVRSLGAGGWPWGQDSCGHSPHLCSRRRGALGHSQAAPPTSPQWGQAENTPGDQRTRGQDRGSPRGTGEPLVLKSQQG